MKGISEALAEQTKVARWFSDIFSTEQGQKALDYLRRRFWVQDTTAPSEVGAIDPLQLAYREGMRTVVLCIQDLVAFDFNQAERLMAQAAVEEEPDAGV